MTEQPLVSIYITTYNRLSLLQRAVESVLNQDYQNIELLIVDDCSTDGTRVYLESLTKTEKRIKNIFNSENSGPCIGRNRAINQAAGIFITGLDDDDYFLKNRITNFLNYWTRKSEATVALCSNSTLKTSKGAIRTIKRPLIIKKNDLIDQNFIGNQIFTETRILRENNGFDEKIPAWQDLELWYRILRNNEQQVECTNAVTYVIDTSHPHERISSHKLAKIEWACDYFIKKHKLNPKEAAILKIQLCPYNNSFPSATGMLKKIARKPTRANIIQCFRAVAKFLL